MLVRQIVPSLASATTTVFLMTIVVMAIISNKLIFVDATKTVAAMITDIMTTSAGGYRIMEKGDMTAPEIAKNRPRPSLPDNCRY